jgi:Ca2+-binding RTX toxin-like protein
VSLDNNANDGGVSNTASTGGPASNVPLPAVVEGDNVFMDIEVVIGGRGDDHIVGVTSPLAVVFPPARFEGRAGNDTLVAGHSAGHAILDGGEGNDDLIGGHQPNRLLGGAGNDHMVGNNAPDEFVGGTGFDTADYHAKTVPLRITLDNIANDGEVGTASHPSERDNVRHDVERVIGGSAGDLIALAFPHVTANALDSLTRHGAFTFEGRGGDDTLVAGPSHTSATSATTTRAPISATRIGETTDASGATPWAVHTATEVGIAGLEDGSGAFDDTILEATDPTAITRRRFFAVLLGGEGNDQLLGSALHDNLDGGVGTDRLNGNAGNDLLDGGPDADDIGGGPGIDLVSYASRNTPVWVSLDGLANDGTPGPDATTLGEGDNVRPDVENVLGGAGDDRIAGSDRPNQLNGNAGDDVIAGLGANDVLIGASGRDQLFGGLGNDLLVGRDGQADLLDGGEGDDRAIADPLDTLISIEH